MRVPPYYKRPGWQRFFAGVMIGIIIGWVFFVYEFGTINETLVSEIKKQQITIDSLKKDIETLRSVEKKLNEENEKRLTIQELEMYFTNEKQVKLSELTLYELKQKGLNELRFLKGKDIATVASTNELMIRTIENTEFQIGDSRYKLKVEQVYLYTTLKLYMKIQRVP
ncbi:sporulation membrane protein YtrI [Alkalihalobacterium elongatum]|uniref:sporulation membrane protein YtrI n=1 Tax=Alkalihalobacterium elongatum TaxID=2675466 RepID=UPI001C1FD09D|nr:sporulation membrane protein YtrI [Alkalihalobacterium elongatum]